MSLLVTIINFEIILSKKNNFHFRDTLDKI